MFEVVKEFTYLGTAINTKNDVSLEIKRRITLANRCYFGLSRQMCNRDLSRRTKLALYKTLILPVLLYGAEAWVVSMTDAAALGVFERKILRKIFGPVRIGDDFRIRMNHELYELYDDVDVDQVEQDLNLLGISNWRRRAKSRGAWRETLRSAKTRNGL
ncbi:uncharacterized protein LOC133850333 [Drosophila sulfurigaster albostrigata]|uniref:uncharacterized protein LOC133844230 n=1 Tax=Drosophila sulfurigaster albostrigata TaxID=89887 RepID=UPI002D21E8B7|nr:uncharacterized protein LOC133844230 [Drosophila sulfurigaster albostrigata]XP_062142376.1 uncharacterized protein LOC133850333 [Drosophila sulfurigaster albostrigata]